MENQEMLEWAANELLGLRNSILAHRPDATDAPRVLACEAGARYLLRGARRGRRRETGEEETNPARRDSEGHQFQPPFP